MLYSIFLYKSVSASLMYEKSFLEVGSGKMEIFSSFFSAIKSFISELVLKGSTELKNIELGDHSVYITSIRDIEADLVIISDKEDHKNITKLIPKLIETLLLYRDPILEWEEETDKLNFLDKQISKIVFTEKKLLEGTPLIEKIEPFTKATRSYKKELSIQEKKVLIQERGILVEKFNKSSLINKITIAEEILQISEKLKDDTFYAIYKKELVKLREEYKDTKLKLEYYLVKAKDILSASVSALGNRALRYGDYKEAYINLYSFSSKLKQISSETNWKRYRDLALKLINKEEISDEDLTKAIHLILHMSEDISNYLSQSK